MQTPKADLPFKSMLLLKQINIAKKFVTVHDL